jgi:aminoglycoside phosphotransferase (APT) family kinase protein
VHLELADPAVRERQQRRVVARLDAGVAQASPEQRELDVLALVQQLELSNPRARRVIGDEQDGLQRRASS